MSKSWTTGCALACLVFVAAPAGAKQWKVLSDRTVNKPKGIWIAGGHLWVTDIDAIWEST
jgi:hypothetical protein